MLVVGFGLGLSVLAKKTLIDPPKPKWMCRTLHQKTKSSFKKKLLVIACDT